jgi:hypothetical protein
LDIAGEFMPTCGFKKSSHDGPTRIRCVRRCRGRMPFWQL